MKRSLNDYLTSKELSDWKDHGWVKVTSNHGHRYKLHRYDTSHNIEVLSSGVRIFRPWSFYTNAFKYDHNLGYPVQVHFRPTPCRDAHGRFTTVRDNCIYPLIPDHMLKTRQCVGIHVHLDDWAWCSAIVKNHRICAAPNSYKDTETMVFQQYRVLQMDEYALLGVANR